jgi:hypothetical protein
MPTERPCDASCARCDQTEVGRNADPQGRAADRGCAFNRPAAEPPVRGGGPDLGGRTSRMRQAGCSLAPVPSRAIDAALSQIERQRIASPSATVRRRRPANQPQLRRDGGALRHGHPPARWRAHLLASASQTEEEGTTKSRRDEETETGRMYLRSSIATSVNDWNWLSYQARCWQFRTPCI